MFRIFLMLSMELGCGFWDLNAIFCAGGVFLAGSGKKSPKKWKNTCVSEWIEEWCLTIEEGASRVGEGVNMSSEFKDGQKAVVKGEGEVDAPERREFLKKAGKFAVVTPAAVTVLLSTSLDANATGIFKSGGGMAPPKHKFKKKKSWAWKLKKRARKIKVFF